MPSSHTKPPPNRRPRVRVLIVLAFSVLAVMSTSASVAVAAADRPSASSADHEPREARPPSTTRIFQFFYPSQNSYPTGPEADALALTMYEQAMDASRALDYVPRPMATPSITGLVQQYARLALRRFLKPGEHHIYEIIRGVTALVYRTQYHEVVVHEPVMVTPDAPPSTETNPHPNPAWGSGGNAGNVGGSAPSFPAGSWFGIGGSFWSGSGGGGGTGKVTVRAIEQVQVL